MVDLWPLPLGRAEIDSAPRSCCGLREKTPDPFKFPCANFARCLKCPLCSWSRVVPISQTKSCRIWRMGISFSFAGLEFPFLLDDRTSKTLSSASTSALVRTRRHRKNWHLKRAVTIGFWVCWRIACTGHPIRPLCERL